MYFGGSSWVEPVEWENYEEGDHPSEYPVGKNEIDHTRIYDCSTDDPNHTVSNSGSPDADLFCSGHAFLADGRLMIAGGTTHVPEIEETDWHMAHWSGSRDSWIFDSSQTPPWIVGGKLNRDPAQGPLVVVARVVGAGILR